MSCTYFTADHYLSHANSIAYANRPFASAGGMDGEMMLRCNEAVLPGDAVYHLGGFACHDPGRPSLRKHS